MLSNVTKLHSVQKFSEKFENRMSDLVKLFFLCNQGLNMLLLVPHKAMLGIMATGCIFG